MANKLYLIWNLTKGLRTGIKNTISSAIDFNETMNKFNVSMGSAKDDAKRFVSTISESTGTATKDLMEYQSTFKNILGGLGKFTDKEAEKMSESLTKMALDYSSLYNVGQAEAMNKFQSAMTGSIRPIRNGSGYDISASTLNSKLSDLGVERTVTQLNEMEKRILRIIVLMDQMRNTGAMGDLARTIEQPANQLRVLKAQIQEVGIWLGNVFMGVVGQILPYINGFVMALKELIKMFAMFVGWEADDTSLSDVFESAEVSSGGVAGNLGKASKNAKELRKTLMGFDVLNVIQTPTTSSGGSGGGGGGISGIDPKILDALGKYNDLMEKIRMKAHDVRDAILEWLGVTDGTYDNLKKIKEIAEIIGLLFVGWKVSKAILDFLDKFGALKHVDNKFKLAFGIGLTITGIYAQYKGTERLLNGDIDAFSILETIGGTTGGALGIAAIVGALKTGKEIPLKYRLAFGFGIMLSIQAIQVAKDGIDKDDIKKKITGVLEFSVAGFSLAKAFGAGLKASLKVSLVFTLAAIDVILLVDIVKWWNQYYDDTKKELYNNKKDLNLFEFLNVSFTAIGTGLGNEINKFFDKDVMGAISDWFKQHQMARTILGIILGQWQDKGVQSTLANGLFAILSAILKSIAQLLRGVPFIGNSIADGIESALKLKEQELSNSISNTSKKAMNNAEPWVKQDSEKLGRDTITAYNSGVESKTTESSESIRKTINTGLTSNESRLKQTATQLGTNINSGVRSGFSNQQQNLSNNIKSTVNSAIKTPEADLKRTSKDMGGNLGTEAKTGFENKFNLKGIKFKMPHITWQSGGQSTSGLIRKALEALSLPTSLPRLSVSWYAKGGMPDMGELFMAREAGPELVGKIGNSNAVMNNQQIVQAVSQGVAQAVSSVLGNNRTGDIRLIVDGKELTTVVEQRIARNQNIYGTL